MDMAKAIFLPVGAAINKTIKKYIANADAKNFASFGSCTDFDKFFPKVFVMIILINMMIAEMKKMIPMPIIDSTLV